MYQREREQADSEVVFVDSYKCWNALFMAECVPHYHISKFTVYFCNVLFKCGKSREITNYTVMISKLYCNDYYSTVLKSLQYSCNFTRFFFWSNLQKINNASSCTNRFFTACLRLVLKNLFRDSFWIILVQELVWKYSTFLLVCWNLIY